MARKTDDPVAIQKLIDAASKRIKKRCAANAVDEKEIWRLRDELHRLAIIALVGVTDGVRIQYRRQVVDKSYHLNDMRGTLLKVGRTRAVVRFGAEEWTFPIGGLLPANSGDQGFTLNIR